MNVITSETLMAWLDRLAAEKTLIAPRAVEGILLYRPVAGSRDIALDGTRPKMSPKAAVFPSTERLVTIDKHGPQVTLSEPEPVKPQVLLVRPCDAHGIAVLDAVFLKDPVDLTYARRRQATTLIGLACPQMWEGCFCTSMGGGPDDPRHTDALLTAVEGGYAVTAVTDAGRALTAGLALREIPGQPPGPARVTPVTPPEPARWPERFTDRYWDLLAERCLGCRICAYVCPTCRCFDVRDEVAERQTGHARYDRLRCWDSCTGANYRVTAGGHNSRPTKGPRLRNRFFCKFYYVPQGYGPVACVGCGRCSEACPVNIDIVEMLRDVSQRQEVTA